MKSPLILLCSAIVLTELFTASLLMDKDEYSAEKMDPKVKAEHQSMEITYTPK